MKLFITFLLLLASLSYASPHDLATTKSRLNKLNNKIVQLEKRLAVAKDKKSIIDKELKITEKQIGSTIKKLHTIQEGLEKQQEEVKKLTKKINALEKEYNNSQRLMAQHIQTRYKMGEYQPIKWLLNQENPNNITQLMTYYQYLIKSWQQTLSHLKQTKQDLLLSQNQLEEGLLKKRKLAQALADNQNRLQSDKKYRTRLIQSLKHDIQNKQETLAQYQKDKENLAQLIKKLSRKSTQLSRIPFSRMQHKLPLPIKTSKKNIDEINQGIMFYAKEGLPVDSVYPGKVVFSDWLRGYGLLIIIDHGHGYMTLYAHNQSLFKRKGDIVEQGEQIATIGHSGGIRQNGLYFEIRHRGKAISPLTWLS